MLLFVILGLGGNVVCSDPLFHIYTPNLLAHTCLLGK